MGEWVRTDVDCRNAVSQGRKRDRERALRSSDVENRGARLDLSERLEDKRNLDDSLVDLAEDNVTFSVAH